MQSSNCDAKNGVSKRSNVFQHPDIFIGDEAYACARNRAPTAVTVLDAHTIVGE